MRLARNSGRDPPTLSGRWICTERPVQTQALPLEKQMYSRSASIVMSLAERSRHLFGRTCIGSITILLAEATDTQSFVIRYKITRLSMTLLCHQLSRLSSQHDSAQTVHHFPNDKPRSQYRQVDVKTVVGTSAVDRHGDLPVGYERRRHVSCTATREL
jgi:hypothetical protein